MRVILLQIVFFATVFVSCDHSNNTNANTETKKDTNIKNERLDGDTSLISNDKEDAISSAKELPKQDSLVKENMEIDTVIESKCQSVWLDEKVRIGNTISDYLDTVTSKHYDYFMKNESSSTLSYHDSLFNVMIHIDSIVDGMQDEEKKAAYYSVVEVVENNADGALGEYLDSFWSRRFMKSPCDFYQYYELSKHSDATMTTYFFRRELIYKMNENPSFKDSLFSEHKKLFAAGNIKYSVDQYLDDLINKPTK